MRRLLVLLLSICSCICIYSYNLPDFTWNLKTSVNSAYLWHGERYGGLSFQQDFNIGYKGIELEAWFNIGDGSYWKFNSFNPELDTRIGYSIAGATASLKHYYYLKGSPFDFSNKYNNSQLLVRLEYNFKTLDLCNLEFGCMVTCLGGWYDSCQYHQVWIDAKYDVELPINNKLKFIFTPSLGICPNKIYKDGHKSFSFNELTLKLKFEYILKENMIMDVHTHIMMNTYEMLNYNSDFVLFNFGLSFSFFG